MAEAVVGIGQAATLYVPSVSTQLQTVAGIVPPGDFTQATAVVFNVFLPGSRNVDAVWPGSLSGAVAPTSLNGQQSTVMATHSFQVTDCTVPGEYRIQPVFTFPAGPWPATPFPLYVKPQNAT